MTSIAGVGDFILCRRRGRDELEGVGAHIYIGELSFDLGHVAVHALIAGAASLVLGVRLYGGGVRTVGRAGSMALEAHDARGLQELSVIGGSVDVVAGETSDAMRVHGALHEVVALHAVLVGGAVGKVRERLFAELVFL